MPELPAVVPSAEEMFEQMNFDDKWKDAEMQSICHYLGGSKNLVIPESFRNILPKKLRTPFYLFGLKPKFVVAYH